MTGLYVAATVDTANPDAPEATAVGALERVLAWAGERAAVGGVVVYIFDGGGAVVAIVSPDGVRAVAA